MTPIYCDNAKDIATQLLDGKIGIVPCDTIWGLVGIATRDNAIRLAQIKKRSLSKGFILLIPEPEHVHALCSEIPKTAKALMDKYWPGPLTLVLPKSKHVPREITGEHTGIAVRLPKHGLLNEIFTQIDHPLLSSSANESGKTVIQNSSDIPASLMDAIDFIYTKDQAPSAIASTVVDCQTQDPTLLREGSISWTEISASFSET